jgi:electron transfer flavoprotein beta subunit
VSYDCVVCVKQVPDTSNITGEAMKADGTVNRAALPAIFNPEDLHALEAALAVKEQYGGTVTVLTMGPPGACEVLRDCLYRGADRAILITDRRAAASDTLATSYILAQAVRKIGRYHLVFCGRQAIDGDTAQVGPQLAEKLGIPQITYFEQLIELVPPQPPMGKGGSSSSPPLLKARSGGATTASISGALARIRRNVGNGWEILETCLPALITVLDSANDPRPRAARRVMRAKRARSAAEVAAEVGAALTDATPDQKEKEIGRRLEALQMQGLLIDQWNLDDVEADLAWCGMAGSPTKVHRVQSIVLTKEGYTDIEPTEAGVRKMIQELIVDHTIG